MQTREEFIQDMVSAYAELTWGDIDGLCMVYAMQTGDDDVALLKEIEALVKEVNG